MCLVVPAVSLGYGGADPNCRKLRKIGPDIFPLMPERATEAWDVPLPGTKQRRYQHRCRQAPDIP